MTVRRPLVHINGGIAELPAGDSVAGASGAAGNSVSAVVDFGTTPSDLVVASVSASWVSASSALQCDIAAGTGHDPEDVLLEQLRAIAVSIVAGVGFDVFVHAPYSTHGQYTVIIREV